MSFDTGLISYTALACLALTQTKHRNRAAFPLSPRTAAILGWALLVVAAAVAIRRLGLSFGLTAWVGQLCVAGVVLVLLMSWRPNYAPPLAGVALACIPLLHLR